MIYHIDTGLIYEKMTPESECPLCEIQKKVEEQFLHEFLNDAVMEETTRAKVNKLGFCANHFQLLFNRQNKLSVALQISTRVQTLMKSLGNVNKVSLAKKQVAQIEKSFNTCIICDLTNESMEKYFKTVAQMYNNEKDFYKILLHTKGFCLEHYSKLLKYSDYAGLLKNEYVSTLSNVQNRNIEKIMEDLQGFCNKHDYKNALKPLGASETALNRIAIKLYGDKLK